MASEYINVYMNNPTEGAKDGTPVSTDGLFTAPIEFILNAVKNKSQTVKLAIRTEDGYLTAGETKIYDENDTSDHLKLCWTEDGEFADTITTSAQISSTNKIFYAKATMSDNEMPKTDLTAKFVVSCTIATVD